MDFGPTELGLCNVNFNGSKFDISESFKNVKGMFNEGEYTYFFKPCGPLTAEDLPADAPKVLSGANLMRVHTMYRGYQDMAWLTDFEFKPLSAKDLSLGVIYQADGEPVIQQGKWYTFDIRVTVACDETIAETPVLNFKNYNSSNFYMFRAVVYHKSGCKKVVPPPTPTPEFSPDCHFVSRWKPMNSTGIDARLDDVNGGPYGIRVPMTVNGNDAIVFYQPCGRMKCPITYTCPDHETYSSAWLCPKNPSSGDLCQSFGVVGHDFDVELNGIDERDGLMIAHFHGQMETKLHLTCSNTYPDEHINFTRETNIQGTMLELYGTSQEVCIVNIPDPSPPVGGQCSFKKERSGQILSINLQSYNVENTGWVKEVDIDGLMGGGRGTLYYQPCGGLRCPPGAFCDGDDGATVWLCRNISGRIECDGYGLLEHNVSISLIESMILQEGLAINYIGDNKYRSHVQMRCDRNLGAHDLGLPTSIKLRGLDLYFNVTSESACVDDQGNTPAPTPAPWFLPTPKPYPPPIPTPLPSPNPLNVYHNDTHYTMLNLHNLAQVVHKGETNVVSRLGTMAVHYEFSPWELLNCPEGWKCDPENMYSNFYLCWQDANLQRKCYSYAHRDFDAVLYPISKNNLDLGSILRYNAQTDTDLEMRISCMPGTFKDVITIVPGTPFSYGFGGLTGEEISVVGQSAGVCPVPFTVPNPPPTPDPTPIPPSKPINYYFRSDLHIGNVFVELDLIQIRPHLEPIVIGSGNSFERAIISVDPDMARPCPAGFECLGGGTSYIWKCRHPEVGRSYCYGIGDARHLLHFQMAGESLNDGVAVTYGGGYSGYQTTLHFLCNSTIPDDEVDFDDIAYETNMYTIHIYAHTNMVCPKKKGPTPLPTIAPEPVPTSTPEPTPTPIVPDARIPSTFGSSFLFLVITAGLVYIVGGVFLTFIFTGSFDLPNESFWADFLLNLSTGFYYVISCGKKTSGAASYDTI